MLVLVLPHYSYSTFINVVTAEEADWTAKPPYRGGMLLELLGVIYKYVSAIISISHDNIVLTRVNAGIWWGKKYEGTVDEVVYEPTRQLDYLNYFIWRKKWKVITPACCYSSQVDQSWCLQHPVWLAICFPSQINLATQWVCLEPVWAPDRTWFSLHQTSFCPQIQTIGSVKTKLL